MESGSEAVLDCEEFIFNLVETTEGVKSNRSLCEDYFSNFTTDAASLLANDSTDTLLDSLNISSTDVPIDDLLSTLASEEEFFEFETGIAVPDTTEIAEDVISSEVFWSLDSEYVEPPTTRVTEVWEEGVTDSPGFWSFDTGLSTPATDIFTTMGDEGTDPFTDAFNKNLISTTNRMLEELEQNVTDLKSPTLAVNLSLCEWYLPTIEQTPHALGNTGIALWVLGFLITFCLIGMFAKQAYFIYKTAHKSFRRHLYSITSIYVVMALLTSIGSGIPRAHAVCSGMKDVYMSIGIGHFVDLTISMYGGENVMYWYVKDKIINIKVILICKCFFCIPTCKTKRVSVAILKWLVWQMKWSQAVYYLLKLIWIKSLENSIGVVSRQSTSFWYMHILNVCSFMSGVMSLIIIGSLVRDDLQQKYNYTIKTKLVRFTILTTKLQRLLFEILEAFDVFPCYPPYVSQKFYKNVLKDFIYLLEVFLLGGITFFVYNKRGEFEHGNSREVPQPMLDKVSNEPQDENGFPVTEEVRVPLNKEIGDSNC